MELFFQSSGRLPRRQVGDSAIKREEDLLARRWDKLQQQEVEESVRKRFGRLFSAAEDDSIAGQVAVCVAVELFFQSSGRLPRRQVGDTAIKREEDLLARRWDKLQQQEVEESVRKRFGRLFSAAEDDSIAGQVAVCVAVELFFQSSGRLPRRQVGDSAIKREEDLLARRWDKLQQQEVEESVRKRFGRLFSAAEDDSIAGQVAVCVAVELFFQSSVRLPRRQVGDSAIKREEDLLARRWDKLQQQEVEESVRKRFGNLFSAAEDDSIAGQVAVCVAVELFFQSSGRLPRRQVGDSAIKREEDLLARRWDKLQQQEVEESVRKRFGNLFSAEEAESARGERGVGGEF